MRYSVYDYTRRAYDYYDAPGPAGTHAGSPPTSATPAKKIGTAPDHAAWRLPAGAVKVGTGELPQGRIASLSGADLWTNPVTLGFYGLIAYAAWRLLR